MRNIININTERKTMKNKILVFLIAFASARSMEESVLVSSAVKCFQDIDGTCTSLLIELNQKYCILPTDLNKVLVQQNMQQIQDKFDYLLKNKEKGPFFIKVFSEYTVLIEEKKSEPFLLDNPITNPWGTIKYSHQTNF